MQQNLQNGISQLMQKDMDRKDFIKHVGIGFVALTGVAAAVKSLTSLGESNKTPAAASFGYGASAYGGVSAPTSVKK